ncbi:hypothetical protein HY570_02075 [Candidatus Micrarchaeota archaeon]|nr:hypothetical protein [Candidatus Micrarchaeota archaeon]
MIGKETVNSKPATLADVKAILEKRKADGELGFEQQATMDYAEKFAKLSIESAGALGQELSKVEKIKPDAVAKIVDMLPKNASQLNLILSKERYTLTKEETTEVLNIVAKYAEME